MSSDPDFERRIDNKLETVIENQARFNEHITGILTAIGELINVERIQNGRIAENGNQITGLIEIAQSNTEQIEALVEQGKSQDQRIDALVQQGKEQNERINALIRIVEGHLSNHP